MFFKSKLNIKKTKKHFYHLIMIDFEKMKWKKKFKTKKSFFLKKNLLIFFFHFYSQKYFFIIFFTISKFQFIQNDVIVFQNFYLLRKTFYISQKRFLTAKIFFSFQNKFWKNNSRKKKFCYVIIKIKRHNYSKNIMKILSNFEKCTVINNWWKKNILIHKTLWKFCQILKNALSLMIDEKRHNYLQNIMKILSDFEKCIVINN